MPWIGDDAASGNTCLCCGRTKEGCACMNPGTHRSKVIPTEFDAQIGAEDSALDRFARMSLVNGDPDATVSQLCHPT